MKERTKSKVFKVLALSCVLAMAGAVFTGCGSQKQEKEAVKGSLTAQVHRHCSPWHSRQLMILQQKTLMLQSLLTEAVQELDCSRFQTDL